MKRSQQMKVEIQPASLTSAITSDSIGSEVNPAMTDDGLTIFINGLYVSDVSEEDLTQMFDVIKYTEIDRSTVLKQLVIQIEMECAMPRPSRASRTVLLNGGTLSMMNISASGGKGKLTLTCYRITVATVDLAAYYMKRLNIPKKFNMPSLAWPQFPSAVLIIMSEELRSSHRQFSVMFSKVKDHLMSKFMIK